MSLEFLSKLPLFADLSQSDLEQLYQLAESITVPAGEILIREGEPGDAMYILQEGQFEITKNSRGEEVFFLAVRTPGDVIGEMSLLDQSPRTATVRALQDSRLLKISQASFEHLLKTSATAALVILHTVMSRLRQDEALLHQHEKLASLGTMAAGLTHELNNPASAAHRSTIQLRRDLETWQRANIRLGERAFNPSQHETLEELRQTMIQAYESATAIDPLARSDRENAVQEQLEGLGVDTAWEYAPILVSFGWDEKMSGELGRLFSGTDRLVVVEWLALEFSIHQLLETVEKSTARISEIVKAVKSYTYLDRAPIQQVDVHEGLENTLVILRHKISPGVKVTRAYDRNLPHIEAYAGELNQVWTNLIDNALDALQGKGELTLKTAPRGDRVVVEVQDNGPGIPAEIQDRIFEPFFTTKPPGQGTGLGLHIVYNIVVEKHHGRVNVTSKPGETRFQVVLYKTLETDGETHETTDRQISP